MARSKAAARRCSETAKAVNEPRRLVLAVFTAGLMLAGSAAATDIPGDTATLRALDKVTARVQVLTVPVGQPVTFGRLEILVRGCYSHPPEEPPESAVLMDVHKASGKDKREQIFDGWMFASSPDISAIDDPVYDIWALSCENKAESSSR